MTGAGNNHDRRRPWHLWLVAITVLALYVGGARDYLLILIRDTDYILGQFGEGGLKYFADYPLVTRLIWTVNILAGLLSPFLLLMRSRRAVPVAALAAAAQVVLLAATFTFLDRWAALGAAIAWFDIGIAVLTLLFAVYTWWLRRRGFLG